MILSVDRWPTNGHLIADVAKLGYIGDVVLDATYGEGTFWKQWQPPCLVTNDQHKDADFSYDFREFPMEWVRTFDTVVFDPPYKLSGTPALGQFDYRYGVDVAMSLNERRALIENGAVECAAMVRRGGTLLVKVQDQVCSGKMQWQTDWVRDFVEPQGFRLADRFDFVYTPRPQPAGRVQQHAAHNASQLLVFS